MNHGKFHRRLCLSVVLISTFAFFILLISVISTAAASNGNYALEFDGNSDMVELGETASIMNTATWTTTKSVSFWVRPLSQGECQNNNLTTSIAHCDTLLGDLPRWWGISIGQPTIPNLDRIWIWNTDNSPGSPIDMIEIEYTVGEWIHIAMVHDGGVLHAYKNGEEIGSTPSGGTLQPNTGAQPMLYFGGNINNANRMWSSHSQMDEVRIWNTARSAAEIRRDMHKTLTGSEPGLVAYYQLSNGSGQSVTDNSGNGNTGTIRDGTTNVPGDGNFARWAASGAFTGPGQALDFDGTDDYVDLSNTANTVIGGGWTATKSVDLWVRPGGAGPVAADAASGDIIFSGAGWGVSQATIGALDRLWVWNDDGSEDRIGLNYTPSEWTHITLVHGGGVLTAYQDGLVAGTAVSGPTNSDGNLTIGGSGAGQHFQGQIDELRLWNDGRTIMEVQNFMFQTVEFNAAGLSAYYRFDQENEAGQTEVVDSTNNGRHGTMTNMDPNTDWMTSTAFNTWVGGDSSIWAVAGNWSQGATSNEHLALTGYPAAFTAIVTAPVSVDDVVVVTGATLLITDSLTINNITFNRGTIRNTGTLVGDFVTVTAGALIELPLAGTFTANNLLDNYGTLSQTQTIDGSGLISYFDTGSYGGVTIDPNSNNMGNTRVIIRGHQDCEGGLASVQRCFDIQPGTNPATGAHLTFYFDSSELNGNDCNTLNVYHWNGTGWDTALVPTSRNCSTLPYSVTVDDVMNFSPFVLASNDPTAVTLHTFSSENAPPYLYLLLLAFLVLSTAAYLITKKKRQEDQFAA